VPSVSKGEKKSLREGHAIEGSVQGTLVRRVRFRKRKKYGRCLAYGLGCCLAQLRGRPRRELGKITLGQRDAKGPSKRKTSEAMDRVRLALKNC